ncbi:o-succinylbenzoate synthase [Shivajiella indica]|uniref:O-succinylbenzoate synthase n=1 Tax=Shivajiella indica TaxID=872115 RepID=A0ABW5B786_9BACT
MKAILKNIKFSFLPYHLKFKFDAGTSRGVLKEKTTFFVKAFENEIPQIIGWGEAAPLPKLSLDDLPDFEFFLKDYCNQLSGIDLRKSEEEILNWVSGVIPERFPSIRFAFETALLDLLHGGKKKIFDNPFFDQNEPIPINGLIWMGNKNFMLEQIDKKLEEGYNCIKMKIGALDFEQECSLLEYIRARFSKDEIILRVDANGAFDPKSAMEKLEILSRFDLHSIEQPIRQGQIQVMASLCRSTPLPIALDEELIGVNGEEGKRNLLETVLPQFIILKPTLVGGLQSCMEWISIAESLEIGWWITSALESNIGLNAISQFTSTFSVTMPQGLGTGQLYQNNLDSPLTIKEGQIYYEKEKGWGELLNGFTN